MSNFLFRDALFMQIKDANDFDVPSFVSFDVLNEFFENYIAKQPNHLKSTLFSKLSEMWILVLCNYSDSYVRSDELKLKDILNTEQLQIIRRNKQLIVGFMLMKYDVVSECNDDKREFEYIDFIDTRLRGHHLAEFMMDKYKMKRYSENDQKKEVFVLPYEMIPLSRWFWYLNDDVTDCLNDSDLLQNLKIKDGVQWYLDDDDSI